MDYSKLNRSELVKLLEERDQKIAHLEFELTQIKRAVFGSKSERFIPAESSDQLNIFGGQTALPSDMEEAITSSEDVQVLTRKKKIKKVVRQKLPEHLEREEMRLEPQVDTGQMKVIGQEVTEKLEMTPLQFYVKKIVRPKYVDQQGNFHIAELPSDPFAKFIVGTSVAAHVAVSKYIDHQPLYRQHKINKRDGIHLAPSTLNGIIKRQAYLLKPLYEALRRKILHASYLQADESSIPVMTGDKPGSTLKGCMLVKLAPHELLVVFEYIKTKHKVNLLDALDGFQGHLQVDGNVSYEEMALKSGITLMNCLVHSRRYFEKALAYDKKSASHALSLIAELYKIEREAKAANLDWDEIRKVRQEKSQLVLDILKVWLEEKALIVMPASPMGKAVAYMLKRWNGLIEYIHDGRLRPDNNLIENQIRPLALGRKNFMFAGSHDGAEYAAMFYSFFATCRLNNIDPEKWLIDVLNRIENHPINRIEELLPTKDYQFSSNI